MKTILQALVLCAFALAASARAADPKLAFTVSTENPSNHVFHVTFRCDGLKGPTQDFKLPVWTPGYYGLMNGYKNVSNFKAEDGAGNPLTWIDTATSCWHIQMGDATTVVLHYDVQTSRLNTAGCYLDENEGYIMAASLCVYPGGMINHPVTITLVPQPNWADIATGLDPDKSSKVPHTYYAPDFDILYDCPTLMANLDKFPSFTVRGVPHYFTAYQSNMSNETNKQEWVDTLKKFVTAATDIIGDVPYKHYTFIGVGRNGGGGIEHLDSTSFPFNGRSLTNHQGMLREAEFLAHEYFHTFNVKRIRPIDLGPFDYDHAVRTHMLWVSEGITSYYEDITLKRSGVMTLDEILDSMHKHIQTIEGNTGHLFQSATEASYYSWDQGQGAGARGGRGGIQKGISYYEKGPILGLLLDFKIRHETHNKKSFDDVMRTLYREYFKEKKRGWTDQEFRDVCERIAGTSLQENFDYAATTKEIDYKKYLGYAGLELEPAKELPDAFFGGIVEDKDGKLTVSAVDYESPAIDAGLKAGDVITSVDGKEMKVAGLNELVSGKKPGDTIKLALSHDGKDREATVTLGHKMQRSYKIVKIENPDPLQAAILKGWGGDK